MFSLSPQEARAGQSRVQSSIPQALRWMTDLELWQGYSFHGMPSPQLDPGNAKVNPPRTRTPENTLGGVYRGGVQNS